MSETFFEEDGEHDLVVAKESHDYEVRATYDYSVERHTNNDGTKRDYVWDYIELDVGTRWGNHMSISFESPEDLDKFIAELIEFSTEVKDVWQRAEASKPEDWSAS